MATFVIFWAALFTIFFFIAGTFFKILASALRALLSSLGLAVALTGLAILAVALLWLINVFVAYVFSVGMIRGLGRLFLTCLGLSVLSLILSFLGGIVKMIWERVSAVGMSIINVVLAILEDAAFLCEECYSKFLKVLVNRAQMC